MKIYCKSVTMREHASTLGWGGARERKVLKTEDAELVVDTEIRVLMARPRLHTGEPFEVPLEAVRQWTRSEETGGTQSGAAAAPEAAAPPAAKRRQRST